MMNVSSCQAASLIVGSDDSFILISLMLPASLLVGEGVEGSWRESGGDMAWLVVIELLAC